MAEARFEEIRRPTMFGKRIGLAALSLITFALSSASAGPAEKPNAEGEADSRNANRVAAEYADSIVDAIQILNRNHVKKVSRTQLAEWALRGLYERMGDCIPSDIAKRLRDPRKPDNDDLRALLWDARYRLGRRSKLSDFRDVDCSLQGIFAHLEPEMDPHRKGSHPRQERWSGFASQARFHGLH
jgi:hypothetical protein